MPGLFGTRAPITSDLSLIIQIILLFLLFVGFRLGRKKNAGSLSRHERLMKVFILLNTGVLLLVMVPSFVTSYELVLGGAFAIGFPLIFIHHVLGLIAEVLGIILVFRKFGKVCLWMRVTFAVCLVALLLGLTIYVVYWALPPVS